MPMIHEPLRYAHDEGHTDVCYSEDGSKFITCGADGDIRIWSTDEGEDPVHKCVGELALAVQQKGNNIYVSTGSNDIQILTLPNGDRHGVLDRFVAPINSIAIGKNSEWIALAGEDMEVKLVNQKDREQVRVFDGLSGPCLSVAISPNSKMVAASAGDGNLRIWDINSNELVKEIFCFPKVNSFANAKLLCRIDFEPIEGKHLAYPEKNTVVILDVNNWETVSTLICDDILCSFSIVQYSPCGEYILATSEEGDFIIWKSTIGAIVNISKHEKSVAICGLMWNPLGNGEIVYTDIEGQLGLISKAIQNDASHSDEVLISNDEFSANDVEFGDDVDDDDDNENAISVEKLKRQYLGSPEPELTNLNSESSQAPTPRPRTPETPLQPPFMPSSTPDHLDPRYLCWNDVGIVRCYGNTADESTSKSIEVEFHDTTFHNSMMVHNYQDYTMGSLSKGALAVANNSQINVIPLSVSSKEWMLKVEEYEEIVLIAASESLVCLGLANYIVKVCSIYGTQRAVVSIPGPLVSMAAFKNLLMVAYHSAGVRRGDQCINIRLLKFVGMTVESRDISSALGPESTLIWLGFSDMGTPSMMDSLGMLSLYPHNSNTWIPFCDTSKQCKSPADGFFVTTVFESYQAVGGIKCKGSIYPGFTPRPTMCELTLEPPFIETTTEKTQMEMNLFTWSTLHISDMDKKFKETALKTFALACKNNLDERALEFMEILANPQIITLGLKYASKLDKKRLVEKLMDLAVRISDDAEDLGVTELATPEPTTIKPVYKKLSLNATKVTPSNKLDKKKQLSNTPITQPSQRSDVLTPSAAPNDNSQTNCDTPVNTQESLFPEEEKSNPFLKSLKKSKSNRIANPLSLTDKFAGVSYEKETKENKAKTEETGEKRKLSDSESDKHKEKQRKLDSFRFTKRN